MWGVALPPSFPSRFSFWDDETKTLGEFNGVLKDRYIGRERERERDRRIRWKHARKDRGMEKKGQERNETRERTWAGLKRERIVTDNRCLSVGENLSR